MLTSVLGQVRNGDPDWFGIGELLERVETKVGQAHKIRLRFTGTQSCDRCRPVRRLPHVKPTHSSILSRRRSLFNRSYKWEHINHEQWRRSESWTGRHEGETRTDRVPSRCRWDFSRKCDFAHAECCFDHDTLLRVAIREFAATLTVNEQREKKWAKAGGDERCGVYLLAQSTVD